MPSLFRKLANGFVSAIVGTVLFPAALVYHCSKRFFETANKKELSWSLRITSGIAGVIFGVVPGLILGVYGGAMGGALIGTAYGAYHGYKYGLRVGCSSVFSEKFENFLTNNRSSHASKVRVSPITSKVTSAKISLPPTSIVTPNRVTFETPMYSNSAGLLFSSVKPREVLSSQVPPITKTRRFSR